jgi:hypothetical protein
MGEVHHALGNHRCGGRHLMAAPIPIEERPSIKRLHELFVLRPRKGQLLHRVAHGHKRPGEVAGYKQNKGYWQVRVDGRALTLSHVILAMAQGRWPENQVDHIDHNPDNNAVWNLREASSRENSWNRRARSGTKLGIRGVFLQKNGKYGFSYSETNLDTADEAKKGRRDVEKHRRKKFAPSSWRQGLGFPPNRKGRNPSRGGSGTPLMM